MTRRFSGGLEQFAYFFNAMKKELTDFLDAVKKEFSELTDTMKTGKVSAAIFGN